MASLDNHNSVLASPIGLRIMAMSDGEPNSLILRSGPRLSIADRLVSLGLAVALVGTQMTWTAFLGWVLLHFLP